MEILLICFGSIFLLVVVAGIFVISLYNRIQQQNVMVNEGWSGIDVQLKKRSDLIPNLVETVKGYADHEEGIFTKVSELRAGMMGSEDPRELGKMEGELRSTLKSLFAVAENYPDLKADQNFQQLQSSIQEIENELEAARRYYNGTVRDLNRQLVTFPNNIVAGIFNFEQREFFEVENPEERENVEVDFS